MTETVSKLKRLLRTITITVAIALALAVTVYGSAHAYAHARAEAECASMNWGRAIVTYDFSATYCVTIYGAEEVVAPLQKVRQVWEQMQGPSGYRMRGVPYA